MSLSQTAANPLAGGSKSLADVLLRLEQDAGLDPPGRRAYLGAVRMMCSVLSRPADALPSTMSEIDRLLRAVPDPARGRSKKTIANTRSRLKAALRHVAGGPKLPPHGTRLGPEWAPLYGSSQRSGTSRWCRKPFDSWRRR